MLAPAGTDHEDVHETARPGAKAQFVPPPNKSVNMFVTIGLQNIFEAVFHLSFRREKGRPL